MGTLLLIDESSGRAFAEAWGLKAKGVLYVLMVALRSDLLDDAEAKETVLTLVRKGFRIEPNLLARIIREIDAYKRKCK
jgi:predicted nucleic acid-binding protein